MHEHPHTASAGSSATSWYLSRGEEQHGPLTDRELLLLAERGGLKPDDLLWKPGFDGWKPVHAVCGAVAPAAAPATSAAPVQDAEYFPARQSDSPEAIAGAARGTRRGFGAKLYAELRKFLMIFAYLWLVFFVLLVHEWIVLADNHIGFRFYGLAAINALVLSKIMLIAEDMQYAEKFTEKPLVVPILYKSLMFSVLLVAAYIVEEIAIGVFRGQGVVESIPTLGGGLIGTLAVTALLFVALVPFFAFKEIARAIGVTEFRTLMLGRASKSEREPVEARPALTPAE
jgi:hypothetical protein